MQKWIDKASNLIEALPYIRRFNGKIFVVKYGGSAMPKDAPHFQNVMRDIALLFFCGIRIILVHGGGPEISELCQELQIPVQFKQGQRITDEKTLLAVQMALLGKVNSTLVAELCQQGIKAVGISGQDGKFIQAKKFLAEDIDFGWVGEVAKIDSTLLMTLLSNHFLPVIAPLGRDEHGQAYNINADTVAAAIAAATGAEKLVLLTDVNGIYTDKNNPETRVSTMNLEMIETWLKEQRVDGGMIPKIKAARRALQEKVNNVHILDGKVQHSLLLEIFTDSGVGTMFTP